MVVLPAALRVMQSRRSLRQLGAGIRGPVVVAVVALLAVVVAARRQEVARQARVWVGLRLVVDRVGPKAGSVKQLQDQTQRQAMTLSRKHRRRTQLLPWLGSAGTRGRGRSAPGVPQQQLVWQPQLLLLRLPLRVAGMRAMERQVLCQRKGGSWTGSRCRPVPLQVAHLQEQQQQHQAHLDQA